MINWGKVPLGSVLPFIFDSFDGGTGASITLTGLALGDILVYKGTSMTQRASTAGFVLLDTDGIDIDTIIGIHGFSIDTSDNTDAGFFVAGSFYTVVISSVTIDAQTVNFVAGTFWLGPTLTVAGVDEVDVTHWLGTACATPTTTGVPEVDVTHVAGTLQTAGDIPALITAVDNFVDTEIADIQGRLPAALTANGNMKCSLMEILTTALTETAGQIAAAFKKFFDKATPTGTINSLPDAVPGAAGGLFIAGSNAATTVNITGNLSGSVGSVTGAVGSVTGAVGSVTAGVSVGVGGIQDTSFAANAINAAATAADFTTEITAGIRIKKNTALSNFMFLMVDSTDHITPKTGLTITATRSIDGAVFAACANAAAEVANGMYKINLANTDLNGDVIALKFTGGATADDRLLTIITTV